MDPVPEDLFVVFVRTDHADPACPENVEQLLASCPSYEEARRLRQAHFNHSIDCVIRFIGETGGGD